MGKGITMMAVLGLGIFIILSALALNLANMNVTILGLDFTTMDPEALSLWVTGIYITAFAILFGGIIYE